MFGKAVGGRLLEIVIIIALVAWAIERVVSKPLITLIVALVVLSITGKLIPGGAAARALGGKKK